MSAKPAIDLAPRPADVEPSGVQVIETGDIVFSVSPTGAGKLPRPYAYAARSAWLVPRKDPRVLILGLGLGGIAAEMGRLAPGASIVGVDSSRSSIDYVRKHPIPGLEVVRADAVEYLQGAARFDVILDDCFVLVGEDAVRPRALAQLPSLAARRLRRAGVYVQNTIRSAGGRAAPEISEVFAHRAERGFREWENVLVAASKRPLDEACWRRFRR